MRFTSFHNALVTLLQIHSYHLLKNASRSAGMALLICTTQHRTPQ